MILPRFRWRIRLGARDPADKKKCFLLRLISLGGFDTFPLLLPSALVICKKIKRTTSSSCVSFSTLQPIVSHLKSFPSRLAPSQKEGNGRKGKRGWTPPAVWRPCRAKPKYIQSQNEKRPNAAILGRVDFHLPGSPVLSDGLWNLSSLQGQ